MEVTSVGRAGRKCGFFSVLKHLLSTCSRYLNFLCLVYKIGIIIIVIIVIMAPRPALDVVVQSLGQDYKGDQLAKYLKGIMKYLKDIFKYLKGIYHMPKYLKGLNKAVSLAWSLFPPRVLRPIPQDPKSEGLIILPAAL